MGKGNAIVLSGWRGHHAPGLLSCWPPCRDGCDGLTALEQSICDFFDGQALRGHDRRLSPMQEWAKLS